MLRTQKAYREYIGVATSIILHTVHTVVPCAFQYHFIFLFFIDLHNFFLAHFRCVELLMHLFVELNKVFYVALRDSGILNEEESRDRHTVGSILLKKQKIKINGWRDGASAMNKMPLNAITRAKIGKLQKWAFAESKWIVESDFFFARLSTLLKSAMQNLIAQHLRFRTFFHIDLCRVWLICEYLQLAWFTLSKSNIHKQKL